MVGMRVSGLGKIVRIGSVIGQAVAGQVNHTGTHAIGPPKAKLRKRSRLGNKGRHHLEIGGCPLLSLCRVVERLRNAIRADHFARPGRTQAPALPVKH